MFYSYVLVYKIIINNIITKFIFHLFIFYS